MVVTALFGLASIGEAGPKPRSTRSNAVSGEAYGASVNVTGDITATVSKTPRVNLASKGGMASQQAASISIQNVLSSDTLTVITSGAIGPTVASAQSSATVEHVEILPGRTVSVTDPLLGTTTTILLPPLVEASLVVAISSSTGDGNASRSNAEGSTILDLKINGDPYSFPEGIPANTSVLVPGVGEVILNEQVSDGDEKTTSSLTVNMIHVTLNGSLTGDIVVASAQSGVTFTPSSIALTGTMTGGGRIGDDSHISTFGLRVAPGKRAPQGTLVYIDHAEDLDLKSTAITSLSRAGNCVSFDGTGRLNNVAGYSFSVTACDDGEPGIDFDTLEITISGPDVSHTRSEVLTGGNLQLH